MKRPTMLIKAILQQAALDLDLSVERDVRTLEHRGEHEGLSFFTITLPQLSDALERGLEAGTFTCPTSFSRHGSLPRFLGGFFKRVFKSDGELLPSPCPECIYYIRQISRFFKKLKMGCSQKREQLAVESFKVIERELREKTSLIERKDILLDKVSGIIWAQVFPEPDYSSFVCHHGPGVTADRYLSNERNRIRKWNTRSELTFPSDLHCYPNFGVAAAAAGYLNLREGEAASWECTDPSRGIKYLDLRDEEPVRVVFVPKTQTAPRVIAIEPSHMQFMQQSIKDYMYETLERHPLTRRSIRFADQTVNQRLAHRSSIDKRLATLDLKDASDRVHLHLVQRIFKTSGLLEYLEDARSLHATLPDGSNIVLSKYASMGSALCFPVEACVFYTLIQVAMHRQSGIRPTSRSVRRFSRMIDIYGDDIIVPVDYADAVVDYLESYALKVNINKSFRNSLFRESCGADYFAGNSVKPIYARELPFDNPRDWGPNTVMSWVETADLFYMNGQWLMAQTIRDMVHHVVGRAIPRSRFPGAGLAFFSLLFTTNLRFDRDYCGWKQKRLQYVPIKRKDHIDGHELACLNRWGFYSFQRSSGRVSSTPTGSYEPVAVVQPESLGGSVQRLTPVGASVRDLSVLGVSHTGPPEGYFPSELDPVASTSVRRGHTVCTGSRGRLEYLFKKDIQLDFRASVKRGCFKSKSRWVSLAG